MLITLTKERTIVVKAHDVFFFLAVDRTYLGKLARLMRDKIV